MDDGRLARLRWRRRGAWMWPAFVALTIADGILGHLFPPAGETQTIFSGMLVGGALNLLAVLLLSWPLGALLRRRRRDLPKFIARDYGGTAAIVAISILLVAIGVGHRSSVLANRQAMADAITRAQAYIGDRAPAEFRRNLGSESTFAIQPGSIYRTCVRSAVRARTYCVVVKTKLPFERSVSFAGYESNAVFALGTN